MHSNINFVHFTDEDQKFHYRRENFSYDKVLVLNFSVINVNFFFFFFSANSIHEFILWCVFVHPHFSRKKA